MIDRIINWNKLRFPETPNVGVLRNILTEEQKERERACAVAEFVHETCDCYFVSVGVIYLLTRRENFMDLKNCRVLTDSVDCPEARKLIRDCWEEITVTIPAWLAFRRVPEHKFLKALKIVCDCNDQKPVSKNEGKVQKGQAISPLPQIAEFFPYFDNKKNGKLEYSYIPPSTLKAIATVITASKDKYVLDNWTSVPDPSIHISSLYRHLEAFRSGEKYDQESGFPHLWHALCNLSFLVEVTNAKEQT